MRLPTMSETVDLTVVILTHNEELNLPHALENVKGFAKKVVVLDSHSTDRTVEIAGSYGAKVYTRTFDDFSRQRKFALEQIHYNTEWLFVLDADELLTDQLKEEIRKTISTSNKDAFFVKRRFYWMGKWIRRGYYPTWLLRLGRAGCITCDDRPINEHLVCRSGNVGKLKEDFIDYNKKSLSEWISKHNLYSDQEASQLLLQDDSKEIYKIWGTQYERKRWLRVRVWNKLPPLIRPFIYFFYRYIFCLGFLDGRKAFMYHFLHAFLYRILIDFKYLEKKWRNK
jgi:glycosyltransferase involved in cell wall biosynthesis